MYSVDQSLPWSFHSYFRTLYNVITILAVISYSTPLFLFLVVPMGIVYFYVQRYYVASSREFKRLDSITRSPIYAHFSETLNGVITIRAYRQQERFITENEARIDANLRAYYPNTASNRWLAIRLEFIGALVIFVAAMLATVYIDQLDAGTVGVSITYALAVTQSLNWMVRQACEIESEIIAVERIKEVSCSLYLFVRIPGQWPCRY